MALSLYQGMDQPRLSRFSCHITLPPVASAIPHSPLLWFQCSQANVYFSYASLEDAYADKAAGKVGGGGGLGKRPGSALKVGGMRGL